jgi:hypothetical protein
MMKTRKPQSALTVALLIVIASVGISAGRQSNLPTTPAEQTKVFVFVQRTDRHGKYSKSEVFHDAMDDLLAYLKEKKVAIAVDEFGGRNYAESATPMETVFKIARDAGANSVLYVVVDRPLTKWIKVTVRCYDMTEKQLWIEESSNGSSMSGGRGLKSTEQKLRERLDKHVGKEGLPVLGLADTAPTRNTGGR